MAGRSRALIALLLTLGLAALLLALRRAGRPAGPAGGGLYRG